MVVIKSALRNVFHRKAFLVIGWLIVFCGVNNFVNTVVLRDSDSDGGLFIIKAEDKKSNHRKLITRLMNRDNEYDISTQFRKYYEPNNKIPVYSKTTEFFYGGSVKTDYYAMRRAETLRKDMPDDAFDQVRCRTEISFRVQHKMDPFRDRPVIEGQVTPGNTMFGRTNYKIPDAASIASNLGVYDLTFPPVQAHLQEAWLKINFDQIFSNNEPTKVSLKAGFFPFLVGRGISLGDWYNGGSYAYGFSKNGVQTHAPKYPAGLLFSASAYEDSLRFQMYYSPSVTEEIYPPGHPNLQASQVSSTQDTESDRHILAGKFQFINSFYEEDTSKTLLEPYFVYYSSPRHSAVTNFDSVLRFLTLGVMIDHKGSGFEINFEAAKQFGRLKVKDRLNLTRPDNKKFINLDHTFDATLKPNKLRKYPTNVVQPGDIVVDASGVLQPEGTPLTANNYYHALPTTLDAWQSEYVPVNQRFFEYHPSYERELTGKMVVCDARYTFDEYPLQIAVAAGYFSGDEYPFNDEVDEFYSGLDDATSKPSALPKLKKMNSFLPLRDFHYTGLWVLPMVMFNAGVVPRPYNFSLADKTTYNEQDSATNIFFIGTGFAISPGDDINKFKINPNVCVYWGTNDIRVWDRNADQPKLVKQEEDINVARASLIAEKDATSVKPEDLNYKKMTGWIGSKMASKFLGWEINTAVNYYFTENTDLMIKAGVFFPGQRYVDLAGQSNQSTYREITKVTPQGTTYTYVEDKGLGSDFAYGLNVRIGYKF